jgi:hypothetical protein
MRVLTGIMLFPGTEGMGRFNMGWDRKWVDGKKESKVKFQKKKDHFRLIWYF